MGADELGLDLEALAKAISESKEDEEQALAKLLAASEEDQKNA